MVGVSFDLPLAVQHAIPRNVQPDQIPRCPVVAYGLDHHVLFRPDGLFPHRLRPVALGEEVDDYCRLVLPDQRRFTGRITRVVEYQQTRIILWVEHPHSPASVTLAVPYAFFEGTRWWYIRLRSWLGWLRPDSDRHNSGKFSFAHTYKLESHASTVVGQSPNIDEWELDDHIQGEFQYLYSRSFCYAPCSNSEVRTPVLRTPYFATPTPFLLRILFRVPYPRTFSVLRYLRTPYSITLMSEPDTQPPISDPTLLPQFDQPSFPSYLSLPASPYSSPYPDPDPSPYSESANRGPLSRNPPTSGRTPTPNPDLVRPPELNSGQHGPNT
ncbi:hypothetical protein ONZ51_g2528 [Trametes cubensis]|uniref:Uncharacterized protein n=1 Tax=Trametes cubensis TaxID=1111947 RepID=A0AAD7TZG4_9APHY|nr:hypothetical protein ONZ51_g2528 [Trametes cubensis]